MSSVRKNVFRVEDPFLISTADVSRAHFNADEVRDVYVRLPDEDPKAKQPGVCGKLRESNVRVSLWMQPNAGESIMLKFGRLEDFRGVSVSFFPPRPGELHSGARRCFFFFFS